MLVINEKEYSGAVVKADENELVTTVSTNETLFEVCHAMDGATSVTEIGIDGAEKAYMVNNATRVMESVPGVYVVVFSTKPTVLQEMSNAIDELLVMVLEG